MPSRSVLDGRAFCISSILPLDQGRGRCRELKWPMTECVRTQTDATALCVEAHARGYKKGCGKVLRMPRPCAVETHARGYKKSQQRLRMPRPCAVEAHARGYKKGCGKVLRLPPPCAVEPHVS